MVEKWNTARAEAAEEERLDAQAEAEPSLSVLEERKRKRVADWRDRVPSDEAERNTNLAPLGGGGGGDWRERVRARGGSATRRTETGPETRRGAV